MPPDQTLTDDQDDFAAAFDERAAERPAVTDAKAGDSTSEVDERTSAEDGQAQGAQAAPSPEPKAGADDGGAGKRIAELEAELAQALHRERSVAARISSNDRRSNDLSKANAALQQQVADLTAKLAAKGSAASAESADDVLARSPELQEAINRRIEAATAQLRAGKDAAEKDSGSADEAAEVTDDQRRIFAQSVDDCRAFLDSRFSKQWRADVDSLEFARWIAKQPDVIQTRFATSVSPTETSDVLEAFYAAGVRPRASQAQAANTNTTPPASAGQRQQDRMKQAAGIAPRVAVEKPDSKDDFDGAFAHFSGLRANNQGNRNGKHLR